MNFSFRKISISFLSLLLSYYCYSQPYQFSYNNQTYSAISNGISANNGAVWGGFQTFAIPIGFTFNYMGNSFTSLDFEATGRVIFDVNHYYFFDGFTHNGLRDQGYPSGTSSSPITYATSGTSGNRILKIQISNAKISAQAGSSLDYQLWFYENGGKIEAHMGNHNINSATIFAGVFHVSSFSPTNYAYGLSLYGNQNNPSDTTYSGSGIGSFTLPNFPTSNTVYIYQPGSPTQIKELTSNAISFTKISEDIIAISCNHEIKKVEVYNSNGQLLLNQKSSHISGLSKLSKGIYFISVVTDNHMKVFKYLIQ